MTNSISNDTQASDNIKVLVRIRPKIEREYDQNTNCIYTDNNSIIIQTRKEKKHFTFDYIATEEASQSEIFSQCGKEICDSVLEGYNGTIFVYGQTGAGKTYTLLGPKFTQSHQFHPSSENTPLQTSPLLKKGYLTYTHRKEEEGKGILPRVIEYLFDQSIKLNQQHKDKIEFECSFLEIYQEQISDLLDYNSSKNIIIRDFSDSVVIDNLFKAKITSPNEAYQLIKEGNKSRHIASTNMNIESSRSHAVFSIYITNRTISEKGKHVIKKSVFHLIDLAGSERQKNTQCVGERIKEAGKINKSLMQLSHVIKNLSEAASKNKNIHIHYRDSKLTHLLKDSLGGNAKTCIIANISPSNGNIQETISTLIFAQSAKQIKNKAVINEEMVNAFLQNDKTLLLKASFEEVKKLREKYNAVKAENYYLLSLLEGRDISGGGGVHGGNVKGNNEFTKTIDCVEEEIENMMKEITSKEETMNELEENKVKLRKKLNEIELELKIKDKELQEKKNTLAIAKKEYDVVKNQLKKFALENAYQTKNLSAFENEKKINLEEHQEKINELNKQITGNNDLIITKNNIIKSTLEDIDAITKEINQQNEIIQNKTQKLNELSQEKEKIEHEIENEEEVICILNKELNDTDSSLSQVIEAHENCLSQLNKTKQNCKAVILEYTGKIQTLQLKKIEAEEKKNIAIKSYDESRVELERIKGEIEKIKNVVEVENENIIKKLKDDIKLGVDENKNMEKLIQLQKEKNIKLNENFDILSENKTINSNKVSLLTKIKNENLKLKDELNEFKTKFENLHFDFVPKNNSPIDIASIINQKENSVKESERLLLKLITKMKNELYRKSNLSNIKDPQEKDIKDRFNSYFTKLLFVNNENTKLLNKLSKESEDKEKQIASLNREILNQKQNFSQKLCKSCCKLNNYKRNTLSNLDINILNSFGKKRKYKEFLSGNGDENIPFQINEINNGSYC